MKINANRKISMEMANLWKKTTFIGFLQWKPILRVVRNWVCSARKYSSDFDYFWEKKAAMHGIFLKSDKWVWMRHLSFHKCNKIKTFARLAIEFYWYVILNNKQNSIKWPMDFFPSGCRTNPFNLMRTMFMKPLVGNPG